MMLSEPGLPLGSHFHVFGDHQRHTAAMESVVDGAVGVQAEHLGTSVHNESTRDEDKETHSHIGIIFAQSAAAHESNIFSYFTRGNKQTQPFPCDSFMSIDSHHRKTLVQKMTSCKCLYIIVNEEFRQIHEDNYYTFKTMFQELTTAKMDIYLIDYLDDSEALNEVHYRLPREFRNNLIPKETFSKLTIGPLTITENDPMAVQVGENNQIELDRSGDFLSSQIGGNSLFNYRSDPSVTGYVLTIKTPESNHQLDVSIKRHIDDNRDYINVNLEDLHARLGDTRLGSVIIEVSVEEGAKIGPDWLRALITRILSKDIFDLMPQGTRMELVIRASIPLKPLDVNIFGTQSDPNENDPRRKPIPLSHVQIQYLMDQPAALTYIQNKLEAEGFSCKFDLEAGMVDIRILCGHQTADQALILIKNSLAEMDFPAGPVAQMEDNVLSIPSQGPDHIKTLMVKAGPLVKLVGLAEDTEQFEESLRSSIMDQDPNAFARQYTKVDVPITEGGMTESITSTDQTKEEIIPMNESCYLHLQAYKWDELNSLVAQYEGVKLTKDRYCEMKLEGPANAVDQAAKLIAEKKKQVKTSNIKLGPKINEAVVDEVAQAIKSEYHCDVTKRKGFGGPSLSSKVVIDPQFESLVSLSVIGRKEIRVKVVVNSLEKQKAHVIVNTTNTELEMNRGQGVSYCVHKAAGESVQKELNEKYPNGIKFDEVAESEPGNLRTCRRIYHGALPPFPKGNKQSEEYKQQESECFKWVITLVYNCLIKASSSDKGYINIAFPALGTGNLEYPAQHVVQLMHKAIRLFKDLKQPGSLQEIIIVVYPDTDITVKQMFLAHRQTHKLQTLHVGNLQQIDEESMTEDKVCIQKCELRAIIGSSLLQVVDCKVHDACDVSEAILLLWSDEDRADPAKYPALKSMDPYKDEWKCSSYVSELDEQICTRDIVNVKGRTLIHCYSKDNSDRQIKDGIISGLKKAAELKCNTVTIPVVDGGYLAEKPRKSAQLILDAVSKAKANVYVVTIAIEDSATFDNFALEVDTYFKSKLHKPADIDKSSVAEEIWDRTHAERAVGSHSSLQAVLSTTNADSFVVITSDSEDINQKATENFIQRLRHKVPDIIVEENVFPNT